MTAVATTLPAEADAVLDEAAANAAALLQLAEDEIAAILSQAASPNDPRLLIARLYRSLDSLMGGEDTVSAQWLRAPNKALGAAPIEIIKTPAGLMRTIAYLDARRAPV